MHGAVNEVHTFGLSRLATNRSFSLATGGIPPCAFLLPTTETHALRYQAGSPDWSIGRTFRVVFRFRNAAERPQIARPKARRTYRNPIFLAREWQEALDGEEVSSRAELARRLGVSRARVTQVLGLLTLSPMVIRTIEALGDPLEKRTVTERQLRPIVKHEAKDQERLVRKILQRASRASESKSQ
jgi:hypothetical protein